MATSNVIPIFEYRKFRGIANNTDIRRIPDGYLSVGFNIDIDDEYRIIRRLGLGDRVSDGQCHSLWANQELCLFVQSGNLKRLAEDWSAIILLPNVSDTRMVYAEDGSGRVFFSNRTLIGSVENFIAELFPEPNQTFKKKMVGGHLLEYYHSRLYAAQEDTMFFSDALHPKRIDVRKNYKQFPDFITMMSAVTDGMYISSGNAVYFMVGADPQEASLIKVTDSPAILYSAVKIEGENVGRGVLGTVVVWLTEDGLFLGAPQGQVKLLTPYYSAHGLEKGSAIYRFDRGFGQYICVCEYKEGEGEGEGILDIPSISIVSRGMTS